MIVTHDSADDIEACLATLVDPDVQLVVIDTASNDGTVALAERSTDVDVLALRENVGWARACNAGLARARAPVVAFVNPDVRARGADLLALATTLTDPAVGTASPRFVDADGVLQQFYFRFPTAFAGVFCFLNLGQRLDTLLGNPFLSRRTYRFTDDLPCEVDQPGGACLLARRDELRALGGFAEDFFLFFADTDLCRRYADRGQRNAVRWDIPIEHRGGASVNQLDETTKRGYVQADFIRYLRRHDPAVVVGLVRLAALVLSGIGPAVGRLLRGRPRSAWRVLCMGVRVAVR